MWAGNSLPIEDELKVVARGGLSGAIYAWGDEFAQKECILSNTWQGAFLWQNLKTAGDEGTSPVGTFPAKASACMMWPAMSGNEPAIYSNLSDRVRRWSGAIAVYCC